MAHAMHQPKFIPQVKFKTFSKYDFVESFVSATKDEKIRPEEKIKAAIIADAIEETQAVLLENLVTKDDLKRELQSNFIKLVVVMTGLFTFLPLATDLIRHLFRF